MARFTLSSQEVVDIARGANALPKAVEDLRIKDGALYARVKGISIGLKYVGFRDGVLELRLITPNLLLAAPLINPVVAYLRSQAGDRSRDWLFVKLPKVLIGLNFLLNERANGVQLEHLEFSGDRVEAVARLEGLRLHKRPQRLER